MHLTFEFNQSQWLKPYTEFNTHKREQKQKKKKKKKKRKEGNALYKLMNNTAYGKTKENLRNN